MEKQKKNKIGVNVLFGKSNWFASFQFKRSDVGVRIDLTRWTAALADPEAGKGAMASAVVRAYNGGLGA